MEMTSKPETQTIKKMKKSVKSVKKPDLAEKSVEKVQIVDEKKKTKKKPKADEPKVKQYLMFASGTCYLYLIQICMG